MKVTAEHIDALRERVARLDTETVRDAYRRGEFPRSELVADVNRRYRWDLFYAVKGWQVFGDASYLDDHIDTALRRIVAVL